MRKKDAIRGEQNHFLVWQPLQSTCHIKKVPALRAGRPKAAIRNTGHITLKGSQQVKITFFSLQPEMGLHPYRSVAATSHHQRRRGRLREAREKVVTSSSRRK